MEEIVKEIIVKEEKKDSLEVRETAKHDFCITVKMYGDFTKEEEIERVFNTFWDFVKRFKPRVDEYHKM